MKNIVIRFLISQCILLFAFSFNLAFAQNKILGDIKSNNDKGDYQKALKQIIKYKDKYKDTLNCNYLICLADYYCIPNNLEYNPLKSISIINIINCEKVNDEDLGVFFVEIQQCRTVIKAKKEKYVDKYFEIIYKSNDLDSLKSFTENFSDYSEMSLKVSQKIYTIKFNLAKQSNSRSELSIYINEFPESPYVQDAKNIIEEIDYNNTILLNTIESYSSFLMSYPKSTKTDLIQYRLENLSWEKCLQDNTKTSYQSFINNFPSSSKLDEAKVKLSKFIDVYDFSKINAFTTISNTRQIFKPFKLFNSYLNLSLLKISNNGKIALAVASKNPKDYDEADKIARLVDLADGAVIFEFTYVSISNYFFNSEDSKLFFVDDNFIKQLNLNNFEITTLFKLETVGVDVNTLILDKNLIHVCQDQYGNKGSNTRKYLHYTYDLTTAKNDLEVFDGFNYPVRNDIQKEFNSITGNTEQKLLVLKLIHGDNIKIKPLTKRSKDEYLILNFPNIFILKNGQFVYINSIKLFETDTITQELKDIYINDTKDWWHNNEIQLTDNNKIVFTTRTSLFILQLGTEDGDFDNYEIQANQVDPFEIKFGHDEHFLFAELNETTNKLYFQLNSNVSHYGYDNHNEINIYDYNKHRFEKEQNAMRSKMLTKLEEIDKFLYNYYNNYINSETIKNQPLESDVEKYFRLQSINNNIKPEFVKMQDSLFDILNNDIKDSIKIFKPDVTKIFIVSNYDPATESWRLVFENPYSGKDFSLIYNQPKAEAKTNLANNFSNMDIEIKFYFNLISLAFEPLLVSITNAESKISNKFVIPFKDASLLKNIYLTNNSFDVLECQFHPADITYDEYIMRYFVNNGKPKNYFNYGSGQTGVVYNLDNPSFKFDVNLSKCLGCETIHKCCPEKDSRNIYFCFDEVNYFINICHSDDNYLESAIWRHKNPLVTDIKNLRCSVYELKKTASIAKKDNFYYKGKYNNVNSLVVNRNGTEVYNRIDGNKNPSIEIIDTTSNKIVKIFNLFELSSYKDLNKFRDEWWWKWNGADASFSPNGLFFAIRITNKMYLYETKNWSNILILENTSDKIYWDCNSYYLGIGNYLIPAPLLNYLEISDFK